MGPIVPGGNEGKVARSTWYISELSGENVLSGWQEVKLGVTEKTQTFILTFAMAPPDVVQVVGSTPNSSKLSRNSQNRCGVAELNVGPNPRAPRELVLTAWQL